MLEAASFIGNHFMVRSIVWKINWDSFGTHNHGSTTVIKLVSEEENIFSLFCSVYLIPLLSPLFLLPPPSLLVFSWADFIQWHLQQ